MLLLAVSWVGHGLAPSTPSASAQRPAEERPRLKGFDPQLRRRPDQLEKAAGVRGAGGADEEEVVRVETMLVVSDVLVLDKRGRSVAGLKREDFVVKEDGARQEIGTFSLGNGGVVPRSIVLIIDYSGSQMPYLKTSIEAAKTLVDRLGPADRMAIVTDDVELLADFTRDKALLKEKLDSLLRSVLSGKVGQSQQLSALMATLKELFDEEDLRPIVIFQTDGDELGTLKGSSHPSRNARENSFSFGDILTAAEKSRATVYTIMPGVRLIGLSEDEQLRRAREDMDNRAKAGKEMFGVTTVRPEQQAWGEGFLRSWAVALHRRQLAIAGLAKYTGGWADYLEQPEQARDIYARIFAGINSRYFIGYYPTNRTRDGKRRKVNIEVSGHPEYIIWGRKTYFAPDPEK